VEGDASEDCAVRGENAADRVKESENDEAELVDSRCSDITGLYCAWCESSKLLIGTSLTSLQLKVRRQFKSSLFGELIFGIMYLGVIAQ